jgi:hypothetical protein
MAKPFDCAATQHKMNPVHPRATFHRRTPPLLFSNVAKKRQLERIGPPR